MNSGGFALQLDLLASTAIGGVGFGFGVAHLSGSAVADAAGPNFNYPQNIHLEELPNGDVNLVTGDNLRELFEYDSGTDTYSSVNNNTAAELTRAGTGAQDQFTLRAANGTVTLFFGFDSAVDTPGYVKSITDRNGNQSAFTWADVGGYARLQTFTDSYGRIVTYSYFGSEHNYQIKTILDFLGRTITFQYDDGNRLVAVITPAITKGAEGNTFPNGTAYVFQYDVDNPRAERQNDLIRLWYPNEATAYIQVDEDGDRSVDVEAVYVNATPRTTVEYGQDPTEEDEYAKVLRETIGSPADGVGGTIVYQYVSAAAELPASIFAGEQNAITARTIVTDRNGNITYYDFNASGMPVRVEVLANRTKSSRQAESYVTWTKYNAHNQEELVIYPEGNSVEHTYDDGTVAGFGETYARRIGLPLTTTRKPGNDYSIPSRAGSSGQTQLTTRYFYDPVYNQQCASIEARGNPIDGGGGYFTPQNLGPTPTDTNRSRYATFNYFDYQQDTAASVAADPAMQELLDMTPAEILTLIAHVNQQMIDGGLPDGFEMNLGDLNGDGNGNGAASGLPASRRQGNIVMTRSPDVRMVG